MINVRNADMILVGSSFADTLNQIADTVELGCVTTDERLLIRGWNRWMEAASGMSAADVRGRELFEVFPALSGSDAEIAFERALAGESVVFAHRFHKYLLPLPAPPGFSDLQYMQQSARIVPLADGAEVKGVVALIDDVTERVARERDLSAAKEKAEAANQTKSDFLASMSHELRTPLTAILGYADLLDSEIAGPLNEAQKAHLQRMVSGAWHLISIIEEILSFSRLEAHKHDIVLEKTDVYNLVREAAALLEQQARVKGLRFDLRVPATPLEITTDAQKVRQILLNILGNAIKFTDTGGVKLTASVDDEFINIVIRDTGPGIPEPFRDSVFEPFMQVDQSKTRRKGGTGLGLPLSRSLAQLIGGTVELDKTVTKGASFIFRLPLQQALQA